MPKRVDDITKILRQGYIESLCGMYDVFAYEVNDRIAIVKVSKENVFNYL